MENKEIRFIDSNYNELFRIEDGRNITVNVYDGTQREYTCKYLDEYHLKYPVIAIIYVNLQSLWSVTATPIARKTSLPTIWRK